MLKHKTKKIISSVSITVVLAAFLFQIAVMIPDYIKVAAEAAVSDADIPTDDQAATDAEAQGDTDAEDHALLQQRLPLNAPLRQWANNVYSYETTYQQTVTFENLFAKLGLNLSPDNITSVVPRSDTAANNLTIDIVNKTICPKKKYDELELVDFTFQDGTTIAVQFTDTYYTPDIAKLCTGIKLLVNGKYYTADDAGTTLAVSDKTYYDLMIDFAETSQCQFADYQPLFYKLPQGFYLPDDFNDTNHTVDIDMGRYGSMKGNRVTYDAATNTLKLHWNQNDSTFEQFRQAGTAQFTLVLSGLLDLSGNALIFEQDKTITLTKENLHNASITKTPSYAQSNGTITYDIVVTSDGTTEDLMLTDVMGYALKHTDDVTLHYVHASDSYDPAAFQEPSVVSNADGRLVISIPAMSDGDKLHISYTCAIDLDKIARTRHATEEETGNTATIVGDNDPSDNVAKAHVSDIDFSSMAKTSLGKTPLKMEGSYYSVITWQAVTNEGAKVGLAGSDLTDTMVESAQISAYHGEGVTVKCYDADNNLKETRLLTWADLQIDPNSAKSWTYHIPDDDPRYKYVAEYQTRVFRDGLEEQTVVTNRVTGKCGEAEALELVDPLSGQGGGISVSKYATNILSDHVTWDITMTVEGEDYLNKEISLQEGTQNKTSRELPNVTIPAYTDERGVYHAGGIICEQLERLEIYGLQPQEAFRIYYTVDGVTNNIYDSDNTEYCTRYTDGTAVMTGFAKPAGDYVTKKSTFQIFFYKTSDKQANGKFDQNKRGLNLPTDMPDPVPEGYQPKRTVNLKMTNYFPNEWVNSARDHAKATGSYTPGMYTHTNWIYAIAQNINNNHSVSKKAVATFSTQPTSVYKRVIDAGTQKALNPKVNGYVYPVYHYYVAVNGVNTDDPLVIEDTFDTSLFQLFDERSLTQAPYKVQFDKENGEKSWGSPYDPVFGGQNNVGTGGPSASDGKRIAIRSDSPTGIKDDNIVRKTTADGYRLMEGVNVKVEETATGARFTFKNMDAFKKENGQYYNFYMVEYYLMPRDVRALAELEKRICDSGEESVKISNTATCRGNTTSAFAYYPAKNKLAPVNKDYTPNPNSSNTLKRLDFLINVNPGKLRLNDGKYMEVRDVYSDTLSVDYRSIRFTVDPPENASLIHYDYHDNTGSFVIPDETNVRITYTATVLTKSNELNTVENVSFSNKVSVLGYSTEVVDHTDVTVGSTGSAIDPELYLYKFRSNHMETGLNGAIFELMEDKMDAQGNVVYQSDGKTTVKVPVYSKKNNKPIVLPTENDPTLATPGYIHVKLSQTEYDMVLEYNKDYYLHEKKAPTGYTSSDIYYQFKIKKDGTVNYSNREYLNGDVLTVRNVPEYIDVDVSKQILGNVMLTDADKEAIHFKLEKRNADSGAWEVYNGYSDVKYTDFVAAPGSTDGTVVKTLEHLTEGQYRLTETGNATVKGNHPGSKTSTSYLWEDNVGGRQADGDLSVTFEITQVHLQNADDRELTLTNTFSIDTVDKKVFKRWYNPDGTQINWPEGLAVRLDMYRYDKNTTQIIGSPVASVTLDGVADQNGEYTAGIATFYDLPRYQADGETEQIYAVKEATVFNGYQTPDVTVFYDNAANQSLSEVTVKNTKKATSVTVTKVWSPSVPDNAYATFRLFAYPDGQDPAKATMVRDLKVDGTGDNGWMAVFADLPTANDLDIPLHYIVKEISHTTGYEPEYSQQRSYALDGETVTNRPAKTDFSVTVKWENTMNNRWPTGQSVTLTLKRRNKDTQAIDDFTMIFPISGVNDSGYRSGYPFDVKNHNDNLVLTVKALQKYADDGSQWEYFISQDEDFMTTYANKNRADVTQNQNTTDNGLIVNRLPTHDLTFSKTVTGAFCSTIRQFNFTVKLSNGSVPLAGPLTCVKQERDGTQDNLTVTFDENGEAVISLRHGESFTVKGIQAGATYSVVEENLTEEGYTVAVEGASEGKLNADTRISFTNSREGSVPTGLSLGITSSVVVLTVASVAVLLILRKRRRARERQNCL